MVLIKLQVETTNHANLEKLEISLDGVLSRYGVEGNTIIVEADLDNGFHLLKLAKPTNTIVQIVDIEVNGVGVRHTLFMMYTKDNNNKRQTTILNKNDNELYMPFINPISQWISMCAERVPYSLLPGGLYKEYNVYYPESVKISDSYPKIVQDFFLHNSDFYMHKKTDNVFANEEIPYANALLNVAYNEEDLFNEFMENLDYLQQSARLPKQSTYNNSKTPWKVVDLIINEHKHANLDSLLTIDKDKVPHLVDFLKQFNIKEIAHAFVGILAPGEYIAPHCDTYEEYKHVSGLTGCTQIYIPINFKTGNLFKMNKVGLVPLDKPLLINTHNFAHALINDSDEYRFALSVVGVNPNA